ncbi:SDR family NAD(P)-dependent oxidoreductase [Mastigocoleus testarum]|uniref:Dehydrogenase n=1 Tax=Mastigocoleus testarum BC008 TaxID=371196 RepID=A0A0V7ZNW7_9CYAN|nr:SDR family oxidoreductase [Mastigocoleus testarum]KST66177.1 dehydrogenase [Mastigocoleus testarum BC008]
MVKLEGKIAFIAGGAGNVGEGIVRSFLKAGATVITTSRKQEKLDALRDRLGEITDNKFIPIVGSLGDIDSAEKLRDQILQKSDRLDAVVASIGGTWKDGVPMIQVSMEDWEKYILTNLTTHFVCARTFLPVLTKTKSSSYTFLGGSAAENTIPNYSLVAIPAAGQLMMAKVLMEEMKDSGVRINEVMINSLVNTRATKEAKPEWITADEIGDYVAWLASDEAHMVRSSVPYLQEQSR